MKQHITYLLFLLVVAIFMGCKEEFDLGLDEGSERVVINGWISNEENRSEITVTRGINHLNAPQDGSGQVIIDPIKNAIVSITDENGQTEILRYDEEQPESGVYRGQELQTSIGQQYTLDVVIDGHKYSATSMLKPVSSIDSITYEIKTGEIGKDDNYVPLIYFREPKDRDDYYLFKVCNGTSGQTTYCGNNRVWAFSILSDEYLADYISAYNVDDGVSPANYYTSYSVYPGEDLVVNMYGITAEEYQYYKNLIEQFESDGVFSPAPATPPGNISNGALGFFGARSHTQASVTIE